MRNELGAPICLLLRRALKDPVVAPGYNAKLLYGIVL